AHIAPIDLALLDRRVQHVPGEIEIDRAGLAGQRLLEGEVHLLRHTLEAVDAIRVFDAAIKRPDLVDLLKYLAAELADRAGAAERHDRAAIDQRVGETGAEVQGSRAARRHADPWPLGYPRIGLRHISRTLLVTRVDQANALLDRAQLGVEHRPAHDKEHVFHTLRLQAPGEDLVTRQFRHL